MMKPAGQAIFARLTKPIQLLSLKGTPTEIGVHFASLGGLSGIDFVLSLKPNVRLREIGVAA
jgi:hypothetical protein